MTGLSAKTLVRIDEVYELLVSGVRYRRIVEHCRSKFGVSKRTAERLIALATERLEAEAKVKTSVQLSKAIARYDTQYAKADARKDHRGAVIAARELVELLGLRREGDDGRDELRRFLDAIEGER